LTLHSFARPFSAPNPLLAVEPTLNALNANSSALDFNQSFDNFVRNVQRASNGEVNWNLSDIDTSDFQQLIVNMKTADRNNWNLSSDQFVNFASSLSTFLAQSIKMQKADTSNNYEANVALLKTELASFTTDAKKEPYADMSVNINLNDSQLKLPMEIINSLCMSSSHLNMGAKEVSLP